MPIVYCAAIECKHHDDNNRCRAKTINLSEALLHTVWNGVQQVWKCKQFELSDEAKRIRAELEKYTMERDVDNEHS